MSWLVDHRTSGTWIFQDHDPDASLSGRSHMAAARVLRSKPKDLRGPYEDVEDTRGDILGALMIREVSGKRDYLQGWWLTGCPVINTDRGEGSLDGFFGEFGLEAATTREARGGWVPQRRAGKADDRFEGVRPERQHPIIPDQLWPGGWTGIMSAGSEETAQREILHPDYLGLVAPFYGGPGRAGTPVFDLTQQGALDPDNWARLQTSFRVTPLPPRQGCAPGRSGADSGVLAWQLSVARDGILTGGLVADSPGALVPPPSSSGGDADPTGGDAAEAEDLPTDELRVGGVTFLGPRPRSLGDGTQTGGDVLIFDGADPDGVGETVEREPHEQTQADDPDDGGFHTVAPGLQVLAATSAREGGFIEVGDPECRHKIGQTRHGETINMAHLSTKSLLYGGRFDCGFETDQEDYRETVEGNVWVPTYFRVDPRRTHETPCGERPDLARWQTPTVVYIPPPPEEPPPPPPPPGTPGTPTTPRIPGPGDDYIPEPLYPAPPLTPPPHEPRDPIGQPHGVPRGPVDGAPVADPEGGGDFLDPSLGGFRFPGGVNIATFGKLSPGERAVTGAAAVSLMLPGVAFRPQNISAADLRRLDEIPLEILNLHDRTAPVTAHMVAIAQQQAGGFIYSTKPGTGRFPGGTAAGGVLTVPPDVDEAHISAESAVSTYAALRSDVMGGFGVPSSDGSELVAGWRETVTQDGNRNRRFTPVDENGDIEENQIIVDSYIDQRDVDGFTTLSYYNSTDGAAILARYIDDADLASSPASYAWFFFDSSNSGHASIKRGATVVDLEAAGSALDIDALGEASLPLDPSDLFVVSQGGTEVAVPFSQMGGGASDASDLSVSGEPAFNKLDKKLDYLQARAAKAPLLRAAMAI